MCAVIAQAVAYNCGLLSAPLLIITITSMIFVERIYKNIYRTVRVLSSMIWSNMIMLYLMYKNGITAGSDSIYATMAIGIVAFFYIEFLLAITSNAMEFLSTAEKDSGDYTKTKEWLRLNDFRLFIETALIGLVVLVLSLILDAESPMKLHSIIYSLLAFVINMVIVIFKTNRSLAIVDGQIKKEKDESDKNGDGHTGEEGSSI